MSILAIAFLVALVVVFLVWVFFAYRFLLALRRDAAAASGGTSPGPGAALSAFRGGFTDPKYRGERIRIVLLTILLFGLIAIGPSVPT